MLNIQSNFKTTIWYLNTKYTYNKKNCFYVAAISADNSTLLVVKKKDVKGKIMEHSKKKKASIGFKVKDGSVVLDKSIIVEVQASLHITNASKCIVLFVNSNDHSDYTMKEVIYDDTYFGNKIEEKLQTFFETFVLKKVIRDEIIIKS